MSEFGVTVEFLENVRVHPNADKLELAGLVGSDYQFIIPKGVYKDGDPVLYFPVDAILPPALLDKLGLTDKLGGAHKNRIKTKKLRGSVSQGIVQSVYDFPELGFKR